MNNDKKKGKYMASIFDNLIDFLGDSEGQSSEEICDELKAEGIDIDNIVMKVDSLVASKIEESERGWINESHKQLERELAMLKSIDIKIPSYEELKEKIRQLTSQDSNAYAYFSNFKDLSEDDLRALYVDFQKLKAIDEEQGSEND